MEFLLSNHQQLFELLLHYKYAIIIPLTLFEGPLVMLIAGFLVKLGYLNFFAAYICLMIADLIADIIWYTVGYHVGDKFLHRFGKYISITDEHVEIIEKIFKKYQNRILIISKLTMGFGFAIVTLITAGTVKVPFRKYLALNAFGGLFWTAFLMSIGFSLGKFYLTVNTIIGQVFTFALLILIFLCIMGFGKYIKRRTIDKHNRNKLETPLDEA